MARFGRTYVKNKVFNHAPSGIPSYAAVGAGYDAGGPTDLLIDYPTGIRAGDPLVIHIAMQTSSPGTPTTPSGWTAHPNNPPDAGGTQGGFSVFVYYRIATGSESGSLTWTGPAGTAKSGIMYRFVNGSGFEATSNSTGNSASVADADVTTTGINRLALNLIAVNNPGAIGSFTGETGGDWAEVIPEYVDGGTNYVMQLQAAGKDTAGTVGGGTAGITSAGWIVMGLAITPTITVQNLSQNLSVTSTSSSTFIRSAGKILSVSESSSSSFIKSAGKTFAIAASGAVSLMNSIIKSISTTAAGSVVTTQSVGVIRSISSTGAPAFIRDISKFVTGASTGTPSIIKSVFKPLSVVATETPVLTPSLAYLKSLIVTATGSIATIKSVGVIRSISSTSVLSFVNNILKSIAGTSTGTPSVTKSALKPLSVAVTETPTLIASLAYLRSLTVAVTGSPIFTKMVGVIRSVSEATTVTRLQNIGKNILASASGALSVQRDVGKPISASSVGAISTIKDVGKILAQSITGTPSSVKDVTHSLSTTSAGTPSFVKTVNKILTNAVTTVADLATFFISGGGTTYNQSLLVASSVAPAMTRLVGKIFNLSPTAALNYLLGVSKSISVSNSVQPSLIKSVSHNLTAIISNSASLVAMKVSLVLLTITASSAASMLRNVGVYLSNATLASIFIQKSVTKQPFAVDSTATPSVLKRVDKLLSIVVSNVTNLVATYIPWVPTTFNVSLNVASNASASMIKSISTTLNAVVTTISELSWTAGGTQIYYVTLNILAHTTAQINKMIPISLGAIAEISPFMAIENVLFAGTLRHRVADRTKRGHKTHGGR